MSDYNGWTNYETWCVNLWWNNDEGSYNDITERARRAWDEAEADGYNTRKDNATRDLADDLKACVEELKDEWLGDRQSSMFADLLGAAISEVNWYEIAEGMLEEYEEEEA